MSATREEMMIVEAARQLTGSMVCFVGIGQPSAAANLARLTHAPDLVLVYESGTLETRPLVLPLSIGDGELAETALTCVSVPEMFSYWLQGGRIDVGFLGAAQIDRFGNINTTIVGDYRRPKVRLPGGGGASEIATSSREVFILLKHSRRTMVEKLDFITSTGHFRGRESREKLGIPGRGPTRVITDLGMMEPDPLTSELRLTAIFEGVAVDEVVAATGWPLKVAPDVPTIAPATENELRELRALYARTATAHAKS